jgi:uncharacterized membrane protein
VKWLTRDGLAAALLVGGAVAWGLGWRGVMLLLAFFVSGSLLTRLAAGEGGQRNARQVLANGGAAALAAVVGSWPTAAGALAAATADTWATEIGAFSPRPPRLITTGTPVARGTSGGITLLGTVGGVGGAVLIGVLALVLAPRGLEPRAFEPRGMAPGSFHPDALLVLVVGLAGVLGMLVDSVLGAALQRQFECAACGARFERAGAACHEAVRRIKGYSWLDNDGVNFFATLTGGMIAAWLT